MHLRRYILFVFFVSALVVVLSLINWLPTALHRDSARRYRSIDEVKASLKLNKTFLPSYFPQYFLWPPAEIYACKKPFRTVLMLFTNFDKKDIVLSIRQTESLDPYPLRSRMEPLTIRRREAITIKGRNGILLLALCPGGEPCNSVSWKENGYAFDIIAKDSVEELRKIAESMISE